MSRIGLPKTKGRRTVVEALVCNCDTEHLQLHNHGQKKNVGDEQLQIEWAD